MDKDEIIAVLERIGQLLELKGENPFKVRAYINGARALEMCSDDLATLVAEDRLDQIDGIGKALAEKISTLVTTGKLPFYDELREEFPPDIFSLFELQGLGSKKIKVLYDELGIASISQLSRAIADGRVSKLPGFGQKTADNFLKAIEDRKRNSGIYPLGEVVGLATKLLEALRDDPDVLLAEVAGSYRRGKEVVGDLDLIATSRKPEAVSQRFTQHPLVDSIIASGKTKTSVRLKNGLQCDLRLVSSAEFPFAIQYFTGSKEHNVRLRSRALERGWSLNEYRFSPADGRDLKEPIPAIDDESGIYRALGLDPIDPELREDRGEFEAAADGNLPKLIEWQNLRGTFHNHTTASDGRASLEQMAEAAIDLGLEYLGIADHSKSSVQANGLDAKRLAEQCKVIAEMNQTFDGFRIFTGTECDILKDGSLDFPDEVLGELDYVVASIHSSFSLSESEMTDRIIQAMQNPHVTMLGHITGRLLSSRAPYKVNIPAVIEAAAATNTIIELNANTRRLELDWRWWPLAKEKGVRCAINPDAHSTRGLQDLALGIRIARKGWLTRADIINCLPLNQIESALNAKRVAATA